MRKLSKPCEVKRPSGRWISYEELDKIEQDAIEKTCRLMLIVGSTIIKQDIGKLFKQKDKRTELWCTRAIELMGRATSFTDDMKIAEKEIIRGGLWTR